MGEPSTRSSDGEDCPSLCNLQPQRASVPSHSLFCISDTFPDANITRDIFGSGTGNHVVFLRLISGHKGQMENWSGITFVLLFAESSKVKK